MALALAMSSPAKASAWAAAGARSRSVAVSVVEVTQPALVVQISSTDPQIRIVDPVMRLHLSLALGIRHRIRANKPQRQKLPDDLADDRNRSPHPLRLA